MVLKDSMAAKGHKVSVERHERRPWKGSQQSSSLPWLLLIFILTVALLVCMVHMWNKNVDPFWIMFSTPSSGAAAVSWQSIQESNEDHHSDDRGLLVFSAVVDYANLANDQVDVIVTTLDALDKPLVCCIRTSNLKVISISAQIHYATTASSSVQGSYTAVQYKCTLTTSDDYVTYVTLAFKHCPEEEEKFTFVHYPRQNTEDLAVCGRIDEYNPPSPATLSRWLHAQRALGVGRVVLYDLSGSEELSSVLEEYQSSGFLELQRYHIPEREDSEVDEYLQRVTVPVLDCRQRLAGYRYILGLDVDMLIYPMEAASLIELCEDEVQTHPNAAGFSIDVDRTLPSPVANEVTRRRMIKDKESSVFLYLPSRIITPGLGSLRPTQGHQIYKLGPEKAVLRYCPTAEWSMCFPEATNNGVF